MCIIIINQKGKKIADSILKRSARINPHNLGIVWLDTFELEKTSSTNWKKLKTNRPFIAHFRYATKGAVNMSNTHPFVCGNAKDELLMMNGTIAKYGSKKKCDSLELAEHLGNNVKRIHWKKELAQYNCRVVTINTKFKSFQIYNRQDWIYKDGVWYSKNNVLTHTIAVYGTLKKDYSNYWSYLNGTSTKYIGRGKTQDKYPLVVNGLPYLVNKKGIGHNVEVDVFNVSGSTLNDIDMLEGHPNWYKRKQIPITLKDGSTILAWIYFNPITLTPTTAFHKAYTQTPTPRPYTFGYGRYGNWNRYTYADNVSYTPEWRKTSNVGGVVTNDNTLITDEDVVTPLDEVNLTLDDFTEKKYPCLHCANEVEYDNYSSYRCGGCGAWFSEDELETNTF